MRPRARSTARCNSFAIYDNDQLLKAAPWNDVVVAYKNGAPVRIRDIGVAVDAAENNQMLGWQNSKHGILLLVFKQPGANVIDTVANVKSVLPKVLLSVPPSIKVDQVVDRTTTIKASVHDVEFTLLLTIALVVMVIFLFLRNAWATIIPGVTVPLSLLGTAALMYVVGYSLDNLSLMALTIAVGFVVDDAIVMLENIYRHIEDGLSPLEATLKGSREIGFTILSISISLVAVFIPLLLMGGIVGRLFREFAVTVTMTIAVSAFVALTLSPTMCALFLRNEKQAQHGRLYQRDRARLRPHAGAAIRAAWTSCCATSAPTLITFVATVALTVVLYVLIPKGFFPQQDTGIIVGLSDAPQDISFERDGATPAPAHRCRGARSGRRRAGPPAIGGSRPINNGFVVIGLKPRDQRSRQRRSGHRAAAPRDRAGAGRDAVPAGRAGPERRRPPGAHAVPVHAAGRGPRRAQRLGAEAAGGAAEAADAARCGLRSADQQLHAVADHRSRPGRALRHPAVADRPDAG